MTTLSRRAFARSLFAAPVALAIPPVALAASASLATAAPAPVARFDLGRFTVTAITDGRLDAPLGWFPGGEDGAVAAAADGLFANRGDALRLSFNSYLVEADGARLLVDTGPAGLVGETGRLPASLDALGVGSVDAVVLTHLHVDHISGLVQHPERFGHAEVYADRRDVDHFTDSARRAVAPEFLHSSFDQAAKVAAHPRLQRTDGTREIARGIEIVDLSGHTPGHIGVRISDAGQSLLFVSDALFHPAVHPRRPEVGFVFEQDPAAARAMRERLFAEAAAEGTLLAATHMPFPGIGRIGRDEGRPVWVPADWANGI